uniref:PsbP C-terminal domain-containing protein n=1 Tax=Picea sitchensis TaxID=3332 RepID=B8LP94_PICSI|nr:unknown [Picea sitchensis]
MATIACLCSQPISLQICHKNSAQNPALTNNSPRRFIARAQSTESHRRFTPKLTKALAAAAAAICVAISSGQPVLAEEEAPKFSKYYGTAASAANYGGYGGNASKRDGAEYVYDVPQGWKERLVSKVEKGTNGTDSEFFNPKRKTEKEYLTFLAGFRTLAPKDSVLNNLSLSDVNLQDVIASAESIKSSERNGSNGQLYYDFEIDSPIAHSLISVTCARNKLYAHFVNAPLQDWARDEAMLKHVHESFETVGGPDSG